MSELFITEWLNPKLSSADNLNLEFSVTVTTAYGPTVFSRHQTAQEAWDQAAYSNEHDSDGGKYEAYDEFNVDLKEGYFRRKEERYEDMVAGI
ncbi:hypothetical protein EXS57_00925 [Candidatus Kaiserbacteria bacterium]|nr:hypothetical protein [Candidatus Kaiserbacteria bacterium]